MSWVYDDVGTYDEPGRTYDGDIGRLSTDSTTDPLTEKVIPVSIVRDGDSTRLGWTL